MGSLLQKLAALIEASDANDPERRLRISKHAKKGMHHLKENLEEISTYLEELSELEDPPLTAKCWMREVRELSYDIEDYIDNTFFLPTALSCTNMKASRFVCKISRVKVACSQKQKPKPRRRVTDDVISEFRVCAQEAIERHQRYDLDLPTLRRRFAPFGPMLPIRHEEGAELVIDGWMSEFMDSVANDGDKQLKVVSVVGPGGIGKSTLVKVLYNKLRGQFDCGAFIRLTRKPDIKAALYDMLMQVKCHQSHEESEHPDLIAQIRTNIQGKRYAHVSISSVENVAHFRSKLGDVCEYR
nr:unnamed protein product [Digitaria exilis]